MGRYGGNWGRQCRFCFLRPSFSLPAAPFCTPTLLSIAGNLCSVVVLLLQCSDFVPFGLGLHVLFWFFGGGLHSKLLTNFEKN